MFNIDEMIVREYVPYSEMITFAKKIVDQICGDSERETLSAVGAEYAYYAGFVCLFTNIHIKQIEEDIDGFMNEIYSGALYEAIVSEANAKEVEAYERAVKRGVERYYAKPQLDRVLENVNNLLTEATKTVEALGKLDQDALGVVLGGLLKGAAAE